MLQPLNRYSRDEDGGINYSLTKYPTSQEICELTLWPPRQGTIPEAMPLSIDLDFSTERILTQKHVFLIRAKRATIQVRLVDADIVRGSRLGEYVQSPDAVAEITETVSEFLESSTNTSGTLEVTVSQNIFGRLFASVRRLKRRRSRSETDHLVKLTKQISRVTPRTNGRWEVTEVVRPYYLSGRYIGFQNDTEIGPLCVVTLRQLRASIQVTVRCNRSDLHLFTEDQGGTTPTSRNKEIVMDEMLRRSLSPTQVTNFALPPNIGEDQILLACYRMDVEVADEQ